MGDVPSREELEAVHCWEAVDRVPGRPEMTAFRRRVRLHQARWREANGHPIGTQPIRPSAGADARLVGSRIPLDHARETGANYLTPAALDAMQARLAAKEAHQSLSEQRLWADLLWSPAMSFNLFGDLASDLALADRAVHTWWPDAPGTVSEVRFHHSPGWLDDEYLGNLVGFDVAFVLDRGDGTRGVLAAATPYHDRTFRQAPKPTRLARYVEVTEASRAMRSGWLDAVNGTELVHTWLGHILVHSMLQHPSRTWSWGRYAVIHPAGSADFVDASARYRDLLADDATFASVTVEELLDSGALTKAVTTSCRDRYLPD